MKQTVIITGGSAGYGKGMAKVLTQAGYDVWITGRRAKQLRVTAEETSARMCVADVTSAEDWESLVRLVMDESGRIDVLVNNAGAGVAIKPLDQQSLAELRQSLDINLLGPILGAQAVLPIMKEQNRGHIIQVSSICAVHAWPGFAPYSAAKAGLEMMNRCLYTEARSYGVRCTVYRPSWGVTSFSEAAGIEQRSEDVLKQCMQPTECGRMIQSIIETPSHLAMPLVATQPLIQSIEPM